MVRHPAWALTFALILLGVEARGHAPRPHAGVTRGDGVAPAPRTYTDAAHGYTLRYPRPWTLKTGIPTASFDAGLDALAPVAAVLVSPDTDAGLIAVAGRGAYSSARIIQTESRALRAGVQGEAGATLQGPIVYGPRVIGGVVFQDARATFTTRAGAVDARALMATRRGLTYLFIAVVTLIPGTRAAADRAALRAVLGSITLRP